MSIFFSSRENTPYDSFIWKHILAISGASVSSNFVCLSVAFTIGDSCETNRGQNSNVSDGNCQIRPTCSVIIGTNEGASLSRMANHFPTLRLDSF